MHGAKNKFISYVGWVLCVNRNGLGALLHSWDLRFVISGRPSSLLINLMFFLYFFKFLFEIWSMCELLKRSHGAFERARWFCKSRMPVSLWIAVLWDSFPIECSRSGLHIFLVRIVRVCTVWAWNLICHLGAGRALCMTSWYWEHLDLRRSNMAM